MNFNFIVNDYILIWNLLFQASISETIYKLKQKLWHNYQKEYNSTYEDKMQILKDTKDFIPSDDTIYNLILESKDYDKIKKQTEKYRLELLKIWEDKTKKFSCLLSDILKMPISKYDVFIVSQEIDVLDVIKTSAGINSVILGKKIDKKDINRIIVDLTKEVVMKEVKDYLGNSINQTIKEAVVELAINNELLTKVTKTTHYFNGKSNLTYIKRQIYPYWLMYLGISKEELEIYMNRDKIVFDVSKYPYEEKLKNMTLESFIDFCIKNKNYLFSEEQLDLI